MRHAVTPFYLRDSVVDGIGWCCFTVVSSGAGWRTSHPVFSSGVGRSSMRSWCRVSVVCLVGLLALVGCGSGGSGGGGPAAATVDAGLLTPAGGRHAAAGSAVRIGLINDEGGSAVSFPE